MDDIRIHILRQQEKEAQALGCSYCKSGHAQDELNAVSNMKS